MATVKLRIWRCWPIFIPFFYWIGSTFMNNELNPTLPPKMLNRAVRHLLKLYITPYAPRSSAGLYFISKSKQPPPSAIQKLASEALLFLSLSNFIMPINADRPFGNIGTQTEKQKALLALFQGYASDGRKGQELIADIRNDVTALKFVKAIDNHVELYKRIRFFLSENGVDIPDRDPTGSRRVPRRVIHGIWSDDYDEIEDRTKALSLEEAIHSGDIDFIEALRTPRATDASASIAASDVATLATSVTPTSAEAGDRAKLARFIDEQIQNSLKKHFSNLNLNSPKHNEVPHVQDSPPPLEARSSRDSTMHIDPDQYENKLALYIAGRYKYKKDRFAGELEEDWGECLSDFVEYCNDVRVRTGERHKYLRFALTGSAKQFYNSEVQGRFTNWGEIVGMFNRRFASTSKQEEMYNRLLNLRIEDHRESGHGDKRALHNLSKEIDRLSSMARVEDRLDRQKRIYLERAVRRTHWGFSVISQVESETLSYQGLLTRLAKAEAAYNGASPEEGNTEYYRKSRWERHAPSVHFAGQGRYGRENSRAKSPGASRSPSPFNRHSPRRPVPISKPAILGKCVNCERENCRLSKCTAPRNEKRIKANLALIRDYLQARRRTRGTSRRPQSTCVSDTDSLLDEYHNHLSDVEALFARDTTETAESPSVAPAPTTSGVAYCAKSNPAEATIYSSQESESDDSGF